jgi:hypothetical protein
MFTAKKIGHYFLDNPHNILGSVLAELQFLFLTFHFNNADTLNCFA